MGYVTIDIEITQATTESGHYKVNASIQGIPNISEHERRASEEISINFKEWKDQNDLLDFQRSRSIDDKEKTRVKEVGKNLFQQVVRDSIYTVYRTGKDFATKEDRILRLRLHLGSPELINLPWELLCEEVDAPLDLLVEPNTKLSSRSRRFSHLFRNLKNYPQQHPIFSILIVALCVLLSLAPILIFNGVFFHKSNETPHPSDCKSDNTLFPYPQSGNPASVTNPFINAPGIKESMKDACGNVIGLSAGATILDIAGDGNNEMQQGAAALRNNDPSGALAHFQAVTTKNPSNVEGWIYAENLRVLNQNRNYIAIVLGLNIEEGRIGSVRDSMRGAYLAQAAYNQSAPQQGAPSLVVIVANSGAVHANTTWVAQQIIELEKANHHIVGVIGWSNSSTTVNANAVLAHQSNEQENVFMLAPSASSDHLVGYPDFLRIIPSDTTQAEEMANYTYDKLEYRKIAILYTSQDDYVSSLYASFKDAFSRKSNTSIVSEQPYFQRNTSSLRTALSNALQSHPDGIYFAGFADDAGLLLSLQQIAGLPSQFKILGGDALATFNNYPVNQPNLDRLVFTSFASQDAWNLLQVGQVPQIATFSRDYNNTFKVGSIGPVTMLAYDAVNVFLKGYRMALVNGDTPSCLPCALQKAFQSVNGNLAWQGVSGQIAFTSNSTEPMDKVILINHIENGVTKTIDYRGCFLIDRTDCRK